MNKATYRKTLDVQKSGVQWSVNAVKGEALSRTLILNIIDGGKPFDFDSENMQAVLYATKPDGTVFYNNCIKNGNTLVYTFTQQTVAVEGDVIVRLKITAADDITQVLYAPQFVIHVDEENDIDVESTNEYSALTNATADAITATADALNAVAAAGVAIANAEEATSNANTAANNANTAKNAADTAADNARTQAGNAQTAANAANEAAANATSATESANTAANNANTAAGSVNAAIDNANSVAQQLLSDKQNGVFNGRDGVDGRDGTNGTDGVNGADGKDGISIVDTVITDGHLYVTLSDDTTLDAGEINDDTAQYGVCINHATGSATLERLGAAEGLRAEVANGDNTPVNDFDYVYPFSEMRKCTLADDGTVTAYEGEPNYIEDGSIGQVMIQIPKTYVRRFIDSNVNKEYIYICKKKLAGYVCPDCFKDRNGDEIDYIYIAAYPMYLDDEDMPYSIAGVYNNGINTHRFSYTLDYMLNRAGKNTSEEEDADIFIHPWHNIDISEYQFLQILFMVEFATTNSESIFSGMYQNYSEESISVDDSCIGNETNTIISTAALEHIKPFIGQKIYIKLAVDYDIEGLVEDDDNYKEIYEEEGVERFFWCITRRVTAVEDTETERTITFDGSPVLFDEGTIFDLVGYETGITNRIKASSGNLFADNDGKNPFKWRGLENLFSSNYTWLYGVFVPKATIGGTYRVTNNMNLYGDMNCVEEYEDTGITPPAAGYISEMTYLKNKPLLMLPTKTEGTNEDGYCDQYGTASAAVNKALRVGGTASGLGGVFSASAYNSANANANAARCRLAYHHY